MASGFLWVRIEDFIACFPAGRVKKQGVACERGDWDSEFGVREEGAEDVGGPGAGC